MKDERKTKKQLINELVEIRRCIAELEASKAECKQAKGLIEMHRRQNELILNSAGEGIFGLDLNGNHTFVNPSAARMLGYEVEELIGRHSHTIWHHSKADESPYAEEECAIYAAHKDGATHTVDNEVFWRKDGTSFQVRYTSTPIFEDGKLVGAVVTFRDITERKMAEEEIRRLNKELEQRVIERTAQLEATNKELKNEITERKQVEEVLRESEGKLSAMLQSIGDHISMIDKDLNIIWANETARKIFGDDIIGRKCYEAYHRRKGPCEPYPCLTLKAFQDGTVHEHETQVIGKDGEIIYFHCTTNVAMRDKDGNPTAVIEVSRDITERKKIEEELKSSHEQLRDLHAHLQSVREGNRMQLAREIHDELGQVLTALKMEFSLLNGKLSMERKNVVQYRESLNHLIDKAIDTVQRLCMELRPAMLDDLGLSAAIEWQAREFEARSGIKCEIMFEPEEIILDKEYSIALFRTFQEVLTNITRHAQATKVKITLKQKQEKVILSIKDNGIGITKEKISNHKSLGLIGIRERIHLSGGSFIIRGIRGKGTTVTVSIPLKIK